MEEDNRTETWHRSLQAVLNALNQTLHGVILCPTDRPATIARNTSNPTSHQRSDPYHVYIKNRVSMI
nr:PREDICTED: potassium voltage-gated channel subfamily E member 3 [Haliaeetus albicilla]